MTSWQKLLYPPSSSKFVNLSHTDAQQIVWRLMYTEIEQGRGSGHGYAILSAVKAKLEGYTTFTRTGSVDRWNAATLDQGRGNPANPKAPTPEKKESI